ncbi:MAG: hypothetical protein LBH42_10300, partial [Treponema sp.]|nr:hypothetical protein [Treponema sp.]
MKALKEKRISLRSLWRRSLVILSLLALVFAACGDSSSDDSPASPGDVPTGKVVVGLQILQPPTETKDEVFEGTLINLAGISVAIRYMDGTVAYVSDPSRLTVSPPIWDSTMSPRSVAYYTGGSGVENRATGANAIQYFLGYSEGGKVYTVPIDNSSNAFAPNGVRPLADIHYTGLLAKQEYCVDDIPDFKGIAIEGVYTADPSDWGGTVGAGPGGSQIDTVHKKLTLSPAYTEWAWVFNLTSDGYVSDDPGLLVRVGNFGDLDPGAPAVLEGLRIPVAKIFQVSKVEFVPEVPNFGKIYIDDPTLIAHAGNVNANNASTFSMRRWAEVLGDTKVKVSYRGTTQTKEWSIDDIVSMNAQQPTPYAYGTGDARVWDSPYLTWHRSDASVTEVGPNGGTDTATVWAAWSKDKAPKLTIAYRRRSSSVVVPIYTKVQSITAEP